MSQATPRDNASIPRNSYTKDERNEIIGAFIRNQKPTLYTEGCERTISNLIHALKTQQGLFLFDEKNELFYIKLYGVPSIFNVSSNTFGKVDTEASGALAIHFIDQLRRTLKYSFNRKGTEVLKQMTNSYNSHHLKNIVTMGSKKGHGVVLIDDAIHIAPVDEHLTRREEVVDQCVYIGTTKISLKKKQTMVLDKVVAKTHTNFNGWATIVICQRLANIYAHYIGNYVFEPIDITNQ